MSQRPKLGLGSWCKFTIQQRIYTKQIPPPVKEFPCVTLQMSLLGSHWHHPRLSLLGPKLLYSGSSSDPVGPRLALYPLHTHRIPHWLNPRFPTAKSQRCSDLLSTCLARVQWAGREECSPHSTASDSCSFFPELSSAGFSFPRDCETANSSEFLSPLKWTGN